MLYSFEKLDKKLDEWGFPKLKSKKGFEIIRKDFEKAFKAGEIIFKDGGIYLVSDGKEYRGYMYMPHYRVEHYGDFSRAHLTRCRVIEDFINSGTFRLNYIWSNSNFNDITDRDTKQIHENKVLKVCSRCREIIGDEIEDTEDFFKTLNEGEFEEHSKEVDIYGYDKNWQKISSEYRKKQNFTCEECGIKIENGMDQRHLHTHHINGDKTNNNLSNLKCLCVLCHSRVDEIHEENFTQNNRNQIQVKHFVEKYRKELESVNNLYLNTIKL